MRDAHSERTWFVTRTFGLDRSPDRAARFSLTIARELADMFECLRSTWRATILL